MKHTLLLGASPVPLVSRPPSLCIREGSKKKIFTFSRPWLLRGGGSGDMSRPTKLFYGLKRGKKGPKMVLKSTKKVN